MTEYCRLCAESKDSDEIAASITDVEQSIEQKLHACCQWTKENTEHRLPHSVCSICLDKLEKCWLFAQSVQLAQQKLLDIFENEQKIEIQPSAAEIVQTVYDCPEIANKLSLKILEDAIKTVNFRCDICHKIFKSHQSLRAHCKKQRRNKCEICSHEFCTVTELNAHQQQGCEGLIEFDSELLETKVVIVDFNSKQSVAERNESSAKKSSNEKRSVGQNYRKSSVEDADVYKFVGFKNMTKAKVMQSQSHATESIELPESISQLVCAECGQHFTKRRSLLQHKTIHTNKRPFECWLCHKLFRLKNALKEHLAIHVLSPKARQKIEMAKKRAKIMQENGGRYVNLTDMEHKCEECGKTFTLKKTLKEHLARHSDVYPFECWLCHKIFKTRRLLKSHQKIHLQRRMYSNKAKQNWICELCGKTFPHRIHLNNHLSSKHSSERPFKCDICKLGYKLKRSLKSHQITHMEFQHKCTQCEKSFRKKSSLTKHMEYHSGSIAKPFVCDYCGKSFRLNANLAEHRRIHTGEKPFNCEYCASNFRTMSSFYGHLRKTHGISKSARNREEQVRATAMSTSIINNPPQSM